MEVDENSDSSAGQYSKKSEKPIKTAANDGRTCDVVADNTRTGVQPPKKDQRPRDLGRIRCERGDAVVWETVRDLSTDSQSRFALDPSHVSRWALPCSRRTRHDVLRLQRRSRHTSSWLTDFRAHVCQQGCTPMGQATQPRGAYQTVGCRTARSCAEFAPAGNSGMDEVSTSSAGS